MKVNSDKIDVFVVSLVETIKVVFAGMVAGVIASFFVLKWTNIINKEQSPITSMFDGFIFGALAGISIIVLAVFFFYLNYEGDKK